MTIDITKPHTTRDGRPVRDLVRYWTGSEWRIGDIVRDTDNSECPLNWYEDGRMSQTRETPSDLIHAPEVVEVTVYYYRANGVVFVSHAPIEGAELFAVRVERVTVGEGLEEGK